MRVIKSESCVFSNAEAQSGTGRSAEESAASLCGTLTHPLRLRVHHETANTPCLSGGVTKARVMLSGVPSRAQAADGSEPKHPVGALRVFGHRHSIPRDPSLRVGPPPCRADAAFRMTSVFVTQPDLHATHYETRSNRSTPGGYIPSCLSPCGNAVCFRPPQSTEPATPF